VSISHLAPVDAAPRHLQRPVNASSIPLVLIRVAAFGVAALLAQTYLRAPEVPLALKAIVAAMGVVAAARPASAVLAFAALAPFGRVIAGDLFHVWPTSRFSEALVLAFLAGWALARLRRPAAGRMSGARADLALVLGATVVASVLVEVGVLRYWKDYWWPYLASLADYLCRDYLTLVVDVRPFAGGVSGLVAPGAAALLLEGLALMWVVHASCADNPRLWRRVVYVSLGAAMAAAAMNMTQVGRVWAASGAGLLAFIHDRRIPLLTTKVNVAASYYALFLPMGAALLWSPFQRERGAWRGALTAGLIGFGTLMLFAALWMVGSRAAMLAAIAVIGIAAAVLAASRARLRNRVGVGAAGVIVIAVLAYALYGRAFGGSETVHFGTAVQFRLLAWQAAVRMIADHPLFGVGIGHFRPEGTAYVTSDVFRAWLGEGKFHAHNYFLEVAGELGLIGGAVCAAMFVSILWNAGTACRRRRDVLLGGVVAGLAGFLITCLSGQPLLVEVVAHPFWMVLGVALCAGSRIDQTGPATPDPPAVWHRWRSRLVVGTLAVLAASIPVRVWQGHHEVNLALASYGMADDWSTEEDGRPFKRVEGEGAFFVYGHAYWLDVPVRRDATNPPGAVDVAIRLDGRIAGRLTLAGDEWQTAGFLIPPDKTRSYRRIDLEITTPAGAPGAIRLGRPVDKRQDPRPPSESPHPE